MKRFYLHLRTTFDWSGILLIIFQAAVLCLAFGLGLSLLLVIVALLVTVASFLRNTRTSLGLARVREDVEPRNWRDAIANAGVATTFGVFSLIVSSQEVRSALAIATVASLGASLSDSLSHEIGVMYGGKPRLITTWRQVEPGENGGVSLVGSVVGIVSAFGLSELALIFGGINARAAAIAGVAAVTGNIVDSVLGATIENKGWICNDGVNFGSVLSSGLGVLIFLLCAS